MKRYLLPALLLAACADLHKLPEDVCGNGVLEAGEACDPPAGSDDSASCVACQLVCSVDTDCPEASVCGGDGICRHGTGQFELVASYDVPLDWFDIGTVSYDSELDIYGRGGGDIWWYRGDGALGFELGQRRPGSREGGAPPAFGSIDSADGGLVDVLINPDPNSVEVLRAYAGAGWLQVPQKWRELRGDITRDEVLPVRTPATAPLDELVRTTWDSETSAAFVGVEHLDGTRGSTVALGGAVGSFEPKSLVVDLDGDGDDELVQSVDGSALFLVEPDETPVLLATIPLDGELARAPYAADVDGDGRLDLVVPVAIDETSSEIDVVPQTAPLVFGAPAADPRFPPTLIAIADLDGDGVLDHVAADAVYLARGTGFVTAAVSASPWWHAVVADFNRDGRLDVAAAREEGIDFLLGGGAGLFAPWFQPLAIPLYSEVGDFDGDRFPDLAATGTIGTVILYGRPDGPPSNLVELHTRGQVVAAFFHSGDFPLDDISELLVYDDMHLRVFPGNTARLPYGAFLPGFDPEALLMHGYNGENALALGPDMASLVSLPFVGDSLPQPLTGSGECGVIEACGAGRSAPLPVSFRWVDDYEFLVGVTCPSGVNGTLLLWCNRLPDGFGPPSSFTGTVSVPDHLAVDDVDGDGREDVVLHGIGSEVEELRVLFGGPDVFSTTSLVVTSTELHGYATGNIDGDPAREIVLGEEASVIVTEVVDHHTEGLVDELAVDVGTPRLGDLDGDGVLDLVVGSATGFRVYRGIPYQD